MADKTLIVELDESSVKCAVVNSASEVPDAVIARGLALDATVAIKETLAELGELGHDEFTYVMAALGPGLTSYRVVDLPFDDMRKAEEVLPFELTDKLPWPIEEMAIGAHPLCEDKTLAVSISKRRLSELIETLADSGADPDWIGVSSPIKKLLVQNGSVPDDGMRTDFIDSQSVVSTIGDRLCFVKDYKDENGLMLALAALEKLYKGPAKRLITPEVSRRLADKGTLDLLGGDAGVLEDFKDSESGIVALIKQLKRGLKGTINFRKGEFANTREKQSLISGIKRTAAIAAVLVVLWGVFIGVRAYATSERTEAIDTYLKAAYANLFPGEKVVDPLYQLEIKLKEVRERKAAIGGAVSVLEVLNGIAKSRSSAPEVTIYSLAYNESAIVAKGEASSFESAEGFKAAIEANRLFSNVKLTDVTSSSEGGVTFAITCSAQGGGA